jgi:asparagine synthetase B (glutamine-hydrolysing)
LHTFTFGDQPDLPDVTTARAVAKALGTRHHEYLIELDDVVANLAA